MRTKAVNLFWTYYCSARFEMRNRLVLCSETCHVLIGIASISIKCVLYVNSSSIRDDPPSYCSYYMA